MKSNIELKIEKPHVNSLISLGNQFAIKKLPLLFKKFSKKAALITDDHLERLYSQELKKLNIPIFSFPAGEIHKTRSSKQQLEDQLLSHHFGRDSCLIGLGGGVVSDLVGFIASTYCRGVPFFLVPTTFLSMVDASIGGKTGINTEKGKNLIGSFYFPKHILIDTNFLSTLTSKQWLSGISEVVKYALIRNKKLFLQLQQLKDRWDQRDPVFIKKIVYESILIKTSIVKSDPYEVKGIRKTLNFGHTIGHAIEVLENFQIAHGEAIAIGMIVESFLSARLGYLRKEEFHQIWDLFKNYHFPLYLTKRHSFDEMMATMKLDKKSENALPRFVILKSIGSVNAFKGKYCMQVDLNHLKETIHFMNEHFVHSNSPSVII